MKTLTYKEYTLTIDHYPVDGFQFTVSQDGEELENKRMIGYTEFDAIREFTSEMFDDEDEEIARDICTEYNIDWIRQDDIICTNCQTVEDYSWATDLGDDNWMCSTCSEEEL